jgi:hypothetical protein
MNKWHIILYLTIFHGFALPIYWNANITEKGTVFKAIGFLAFLSAIIFAIQAIKDSTPATRLLAGSAAVLYIAETMFICYVEFYLMNFAR